MFTTGFRFFDPAYAENKSALQTLYLQLSLNHVAYTVFDEQHNRFVALETYDTHLKNTEDFLPALSEWIAQIPGFHELASATSVLLLDFSKTTIVPEQLYNAQEKELYYRFNNSGGRKDEFFSDKLKTANAHVIYTLPAQFRQSLQSLFPASVIYHHASIFIESILLLFKNSSENPQIFINVRTGLFDIVILKERKLHFFNTFSYTTKEDFLYYLIFVMEQLLLNPESAEICLMGSIEKDSSIFEMMYRYVRNIRFYQQKGNPENSVFNTFPDHFFFTLHNVRQCV
ncbi:MAG: DUF3822 family protein [Lentimicrobiaceae bacterium]|nr:DUF3822 family protein [Lentimicrobiaceae bacterium]